MKVVLQGCLERKRRGDRGGQQKERRLVGLSKVCVMGCRLKRVIHDVIDQLQPDYSVRAQAPGGYERQELELRESEPHELCWLDRLDISKRLGGVRAAPDGR